ncbi:hypothetical protein D3C77_693660 [compost metagenome]
MEGTDSFDDADDDERDTQRFRRRWPSEMEKQAQTGREDHLQGQQLTGECDGKTLGR